MMRHLLTLCLLLLLANPAWIHPAWGHSASTAYLDITADGPKLDVQWSIALRDLDDVVGLDDTGSGALTWGAVQAHQADIEAYALARLRLEADGAACPPGKVALLADRLNDGGYAVLRFTAACPAAPRQIGVRYGLLFDRDPLHRGLLRVSVDGAVQALALSPARPAATFDGQAGLAGSFGRFFLTGAAHLLTGPDHLLFAAMLLLPALLWRGGPGGGAGGWAAFRSAAVVFSAFTAAHALTLGSAVLGVLSLPPALVDGAIALTILLTALDNIRQFLPGPRWALAFGFGLIHGFGYAATLGPLHLPPAALAVALLAFNLGLEAAQLALAALLLPVGWLMGHAGLARRALRPGASGAAALLALGWLADRAGGWQFMPF